MYLIFTAVFKWKVPRICNYDSLELKVTLVIMLLVIQKAYLVA